jgi:hypothetical protein
VLIFAKILTLYGVGIFLFSFTKLIASLQTHITKSGYTKGTIEEKGATSLKIIRKVETQEQQSLFNKLLVCGSLTHGVKYGNRNF